MTQAVQKIEPQGAALTPMEMWQQSGGKPEVLAQFMDLQERWEKSEARKAFNEAIAQAKAKIPAIIRNATGHNKKKYADFAQIAGVVEPILAEHGLGFRFRSETSDRISVTCIIFHRDGHSEETTLTGPPDTTGNKNAVQAIGSTSTYLQRYTLMLALGLAAAHDDDGKEGGDGAKLSDEDIQNLREMMKASGCPEPHFLKWAKAEKIEDIPAAFYDSCVNAIQQYKGGKAGK